jgi:CRISPR-associated protein (TIGR03986 family)
MNKNYMQGPKRFTEETREFVNPYNFVSLPGGCGKTVDAFANLRGGEYSGVIYCELETLTPLCIPNTTTNKAFPFSTTVTDRRGSRKTFTGNAYDFFSYEDLSGVGDCTQRFARPIVPGSSIRGAVRSAFEAVTNSCLSTCDDEDLTLHRRSTVPKSSYGILAKTESGYELFSAEKVMLNTGKYYEKPHTYGVPVDRHSYQIRIGGADITTGGTVYIKYKQAGAPYTTSRGYRTALYGVLSISPRPQAGYQPGILFLGEKFQNKHHDAVFVKSPAKPKPVSGEDYERFFTVWEQYQHDSPGSYPHYITLPEIPVYISSVGDTLYLAPACVSKEVFDAKLSTLLGEHSPCLSAKEKVCPACALFGLVSRDTDGALASRVMFKDAVPVNFNPDNPSDFYEKPRQLPILGTPRVSATEFYTEDYRNKFKIWNYDYGISHGDKRGGGKAEHFVPKLRGRKFYWHSKELTPHGKEDRADLTAKVRAVKPGKSFKFEIAFDRLTKEELDTLLWTLTFGDNGGSAPAASGSSPEPCRAHKLGHGKPIGYGSVIYRVVKTAVYTLKDDLTIETSDYVPDYSRVRAAKKAASDYMKLTSYKDAPGKIAYPIGVRVSGRGSDSGVYQWFGLNKGKMNDPEFRQVLAAPGEIVPEPRTRPIPEPVPGPDPGPRPPAFDRPKLRTALDNYQFNPQSRKLLDDFLAHYEADPEYYKDFKGTYESIKAKYKK